MAGDESESKSKSTTAPSYELTDVHVPPQNQHQSQSQSSPSQSHRRSRIPFHTKSSPYPPLSSDYTCPEYTTPGLRGFLSRLTYSWLDPLMIQGRKSPLELEDLWKMDERILGPKVLRDVFERAWKEDMEK
ncbi:hypothetical protein HK104_000983, partial [Borealophlyctis nickersoniae]